MGRRKLSVPLPDALLTPLALPKQYQVEMEIVEFTFPDSKLTPEEEEVRDYVRKTSERAMDESMESLRLDGVTEEQIADLVKAVRLETMVRLLDLDLDQRALHFIESGGTTLSVSATIAAELLPEVADLLREGTS